MRTRKLSACRRSRMNWIKRTILTLTAGLPLCFIAFSYYVKTNNPDGYNMGVGVVYLLFMVVQIGLSVVSAVAYNAIAIALCSIGVMMAIGFIL